MIFNLNFVLIFYFLIVNSFYLNQNKNVLQNDFDVIVDCNYTLESAISGLEIPKNIISQLTLIEVEYYSFDKRLHRGQLVLNKKAAKDIIEIFEIIKEIKFPINKVVPVVFYNWSDEESMKDNNTSSFNYRKVKGFKVLSAHSTGMAMDINPVQNPHVKGKVVMPANGLYDVKREGTILKESRLVNEFKKRGWQWGGRWRSSKDYQHFEKK